MPMTEKLFLLIEKYKNNKNRLVVADLDEYKFELNQLIHSVRFNEDVERAVFEGPIEAAMQVFGSASVSSGTIDSELLDQLFNCSSSNKNSHGVLTTRLVYLWSFYYKNGYGSNDIVRDITYKIAKNSTSPKGEYNKNVIESIRKNMLQYFNDSLPLHAWENQESKNWYQARDMFLEAVFEAGLGDYEFKIRTIVYNWLLSSKLNLRTKDGKFPGLENYLASKENSNNIKEARIGQESARQDDQITGKGLKTDEIRSDSHETPEWKKALRFIEKTIWQMEAKYGNLSLDYNCLVTELNDYKKRVAVLETINEEQEDTISNERNRVSELLTIEQNSNNKIAEQEAEITERKKLISTLISDKSRIPDEYTSKMASRLIVDYNEFIKYKDQEMTVDFGESLKLQLESVYAILKKNGINLG